MTDAPAIAAGEDLPDWMRRAPAQAGSGNVIWPRTAKPLRGLHRWAAGWLWIYLVAEAASAISNGLMLIYFNTLERGAIQDETAAYAVGSVIDLIKLVSDIGLGVAVLTCYFLVGRFIYRAMKNLWDARARNLTVSPLGAVGFYAVPILALYKPFIAMKQIWAASHDPARPKPAKGASFGAWWGAWVIGNILSYVSARMWIRAGGLSDEITDFELYKATLGLDIVSSIFAIACVIFLQPILRGISKAQTRLAETTSAP